MREYIRRCKEAYSTGGSKIEYVRHVLLEFEDPGRRELVWRGTKALIDLSRDQRRGKFIPMHSIRLLSGVTKCQSKTAGLWPWLERHADVIEREQGEGAYRIKSEFYDAMQQVFNNPSQVAYEGAAAGPSR